MDSIKRDRDRENKREKEGWKEGRKEREEIKKLKSAYIPGSDEDACTAR